MARVALEGVSKRFGRSVAVDGLDLEVAKHEYLVLVGPSGCGKSTSLRMIAGLDRPTAGIIRIGERVVNDLAARERDIAMVFQNQPLYPHLTVRGNLEFGIRQRNAGGWLASTGLFASTWRRLARLREESGPATRQQEMAVLVREAARGLEIEHLLDRRPRQLSGGERQRVALGRAMVRNPAVFLLDEPLSNLDANLRVELRRLLRELHERSAAATIHVTHDQAEALALADRVAVMEHGRIRQVGTPQEVYDRPTCRFVASFLGNPPMNLVEGRLVEREGVWMFATANLHMELEVSGDEEQRQEFRRFVNRDVLLGVRPERLVVLPMTGGGARRELPAMQVASLEHFGDVSWIHLEGARPKSAEKFAGTKLIGKTHIRTALQPGEPVVARCELSHVHWFDRQSGERIT